MTVSEKSGADISIARVIACGVFRTALDEVGIARRYPSLGLTWLPAVLHMHPKELEAQLIREIAAREGMDERFILLYGDCFPDMSEFCRVHGVTKVPGCHCYEMFLGSEEFREIMDETAGTFFMERELILHFREYCSDPLELQDEEMRRLCFRHYRRIIYLRQPSDPDLGRRAADIAGFLGLDLEVRDIGYGHLEQRITEAIGAGSDRRIRR